MAQISQNNLTPQEEDKDDDRLAFIAFKRKQIILIALSLFLTLAILIAATVAWFASNRDVDSSGMEIQVHTTPNLIIADSVSGVQTNTLTDTMLSLSFSNDVSNLYAAQHCEFSETEPENKTGLKYVTNPFVVTLDKGLEKTGTTLEYAAVPKPVTGDTKLYYVDYSVYIASHGEEFNASALNVEMELVPQTEGNAEPTAEQISAVSSTDYLQAASIDFYVKANGGESEDIVSSANYMGTLNAAGLALSNDTAFNADATCTEVNLLSANPSTMYHNTEGHYKVTMRCYFDGALLKSATQAYVYSDNLSTLGFAMNVSFTAVDAATTTTE